MAAKTEVSIVLKAVNYASSELEKVKEQTRGLREVGSQLQQTGLTMMGWGAAIAAPFGLALKQFMGFEEEMRNVNAIMQGTEEDFQALSKTVNDVAMNSSFMTSEIASAAYALASAGKKRVEIEAMIGPVSNLAEAMHSELRPTAELVTDTLDQFGLSAKETGRVVDIFATSVGSSPETLERLSYGMRYAGSTAAGFGYSLEETVAALMAFETAGIHGEQAGTTLRNALARLAAPTKDVVDALKMYGLTIEDVNPAQHSFVEILEAMRRAGVDTTGTYEIFGTEIGGRMAAAVSTGVEKIKDFTATLENSAGAAERMKEEQLSSLAGEFKLLKSSLESLGNSFAALFKDEVSKAINWIRDLANWLNNLDEGTKRLIVNVAKWGSILLIGAGAVNFLTGTVMKTIASFKSWGSIIGSVIKLITGKVAAAGAAGQALTTLSGTAVSTGTSLAGIGSSAAGVGAKLLAFATGPVGITIAAIAGITAGSIALYKVMDNLSKDWFKSDLEKALNQVRETADGTVETMEEVSRRFSNLSSQASDDTRKLSGTITGTFSQLEEAVRGFDQINSTVAVKAAMNMQKIAEEAGYTGDAFRDLAKEFSESLTVSSEEVVSKLKKTMEEVNAVAIDTEVTNNRIAESVKSANEAMAESSRETQSVLENLVSSYERTGDAILESTTKQMEAVNLIKTHANDSADAFFGMTEKLKTSSDSASKAVGVAMSDIAVKLAEQGKLSEEETQNIESLRKEYDRLSESLKNVVERYGESSDETEKVRGQLDEVIAQYSEAGLALNDVLIDLLGVQELSNSIVENLESSSKSISYEVDTDGAVRSLGGLAKAIDLVSFQGAGSTEAFVTMMERQKKSANDASNEVGIALGRVVVAMAEQGKVAKDQVAGLKELYDAYDSLSEELETVEERYGTNSSQADSLRTSLNTLKGEIASLGWSAGESAVKFGDVKEILQQTATEVQKTGKHINEFLYGSENFAATKEEALQRVRTQFKATETDSLGLVNAFNKLTKPAKMFGNDVDVMGVALADLEIELYKSGVLTNNQTSWLISLSEQIASTREEYRKAISTYGENSREANALKTSLQELEVIYGRNGKSAAQAVFDSYGFGETLVFLRENLGLTSAAFAKLLGISDTNILAQDAKTINEQWKKVNEGSGFAADALKSIQNQSKETSAKLTEMADAVTDTFDKQKKAITSLREELDTLKTKQVEYLDALAKAETEGDTEAIEKYRDRLQETAEAAGTLAEQIEDQKDQMLLFYQTFKDNAEKTDEFGRSLKDIEPELSEFASSLEEVETEFQTTWGNILNISKNGADAVIAEFKRASDEIVGHSIVPDMREEVIREMAQLASGMRDETVRGAANSVASFADMSKGLSNYLSKMRKEAGDFSLDRVSTAANEIPEYFSSLSEEASSAINSIRKLYNLDWLDETFRETAGMTRNMSGILREFQRETNGISRELGEFMPNGGDLTVPKIERKKEYHIFLDIRKEEYADKDELIRRIARELELAGEI